SDGSDRYACGTETLAAAALVLGRRHGSHEEAADEHGEAAETDGENGEECQLAEREEPGEHDDSAEEDHRAAEAHGLVDEDEAAESQCAAEGVGDVEPGRAGDVAGIAAADELGRRPDRDEECVYGGDED